MVKLSNWQFRAAYPDIYYSRLPTAEAEALVTQHQVRVKQPMLARIRSLRLWSIQKINDGQLIWFIHVYNIEIIDGTNVFFLKDVWHMQIIGYC